MKNLKEVSALNQQTVSRAQLRRRYQNDGFLLHTQPVLSPDLIERAAQGMDMIRNGDNDTGEPPADYFWKPGDDPLKLCKIEQPQLASLALREAICAPELGRLAGAISGAKMVQVWWVQLLYKPSTPSTASADTSIGWHQDKQYWKDWDEDSELFTAWLALSDVTPEAGPMIFVRGSHKWGLLDEGNFFLHNQNALEEVRENIHVPAGAQWEEVPTLLPPGGVSFHHRLTFHGSHPNTSGQPRRSLAIHLRTEKSRTQPEAWVGRYLDRPEICPVIYQG